jgi:hypothetical protein
MSDNKKLVSLTSIKYVIKSLEQSQILRYLQKLIFIFIFTEFPASVNLISRVFFSVSFLHFHFYY